MENLFVRYYVQNLEEELLDNRSCLVSASVGRNLGINCLPIPRLLLLVL